jgi:hypothetical protein
MKTRTEDANHAGGPLSSSRGRPPQAPPSDLELMLWVDGELAATRASEVEDYVARDARARAVVDSLRLGADLLQSRAEQCGEEHDGDHMIEDIMDSASAEASRRWMAPARRSPAWRTPAIAALGLGFAVAAAFAIVLRSVTHSRLPLTEGHGAISAMTRPGEGQEEPGLTDGAIAVVDFGARPGAVLYFSSDNAGPTAVVWLTDDDAEDTQ